VHCGINVVTFGTRFLAAVSFSRVYLVSVNLFIVGYCAKQISTPVFCSRSIVTILNNGDVYGYYLSETVAAAENILLIILSLFMLQWLQSDVLAVWRQGAGVQA